MCTFICRAISLFSVGLMHLFVICSVCVVRDDSVTLIREHGFRPSFVSVALSFHLCFRVCVYSMYVFVRVCLSVVSVVHVE